jgi:peptidoglycan/xylan/chitin deacetylase (PgdA/CDA1 family)
MSEKKYATRWKQAAPMPTGIVGKARSALRHVTLSTLSLANRSLDESFLRCLYCHTVFDDQIQEFERLLLELKRTGTFVDTDTCVQMLSGEKTIDNRYYHLSFDDGFRNNFVNALPILRKHDIPCIFFVPSSLIDASWDSTKVFCRQTTRYRDVIEMMKWEDLAQVILSGYEVGSHTRTHARFSAISHDCTLLQDEILGSKQELEMHLGVPCKYISWPYGRITDADAVSLEVAKSSGYQACFGAFRGSVIPAATDIFRIPRHHFEVQWPVSHIKYFARGNMEAA